jgi:threonine dehydratase
MSGVVLGITIIAGIPNLEGLVFIPPYDDELVIAGQGTIANEILRQWRDVECDIKAIAM